MHSYLVKDGLYGILIAAEVYSLNKHMFDADIGSIGLAFERLHI